MSAGKASEAVRQHQVVFLLADRSVDQSPSNADVLSVASDHMRSNIRQVRLTESDEMRPRLAKDVLEALSDEEG